MNTYFKNSTNAILTVMLLLVSTTSCAQTGIKASKNYITKDLNVSDFDAIELIGSSNVIYTQSNDGETKVQIYGSDNIIDLLDVTVKDKTLYVQFKNKVSIYGESKLEVRAGSLSLKSAMLKGSGGIELKGNINSPELNIQLTGSGDIKCKNIVSCKDLLNIKMKGSGSINVQDVRIGTGNFELNGSGDIDVQNVIADTGNFKLTGSGDIKTKSCKVSCLRVGLKGSGDVNIKAIDSFSTDAQLSGSGDMMLSGKTQDLTLSLSNSGDIRASELKAQNVSATLKGSGNINCYAEKTLTGRVNGSGDIGYKGNPEVKAIHMKSDKIHKL